MDTKARIFELLDKRGIEQKSFALTLGVSEDTVSNWRRGVSKSYNRYLVQIAQVLGVTSEYLLTGKTQSSPSPEGDRLPDAWYALSPAQKAQVEEYMKFLVSHRDND